MLWGRFDNERAGLNICDNPNFEPGSGINEVGAVVDAAKKLFESMKGEHHAIIKAKEMAFLLDNAAIEVNPADWFGFNFCGWTTRHKTEAKEGAFRPLAFMNRAWLEELDLNAPESFKRATRGNVTQSGGGDGALEYWPDYDHSVPDWDSVIGLGFVGLLARVKDAHQRKIADGSITEEQEIYYTTVEMAYEALLRFCNRLLECAKKHADEDEKMPIVIEALEVMCTDKPKTLYQFLLIVFLYHLVQEFVDLIQVRTLGNLDVDGYPFYKKDLEEGRLTREQAKELFKYFFERFTNEAHLHGQPLYFGGMDENENSLINDLSYLMLEAYDESADKGPMNMKIFLKVMPNTPDKFLKVALDMLRRGNNSMVFVNEELGVKAFRKMGCTEEEVHRLVATGCNNFATRGHETTPEHVYVNLAKGIELAFNQGISLATGNKVGCDTPPVSEMNSYEDFLRAYIAQVECLIGKAFDISDFYDAHLYDINPALFYSGTMPESVESGKDAYWNGVKYCNTDMFLSCHATAADSLMMIKKYVFDQKRISLTELHQALLANWEGYEELREEILNDPEKFGNDIDSVDSIAVSLMNHFTSIVTNRKNVRGGHFVVCGESIWWAHRWGTLCAATPDGRATGDSLSKNMGATMGQDRRGITALIKSVTKLDATNTAYGAPFDYMLHPTAVKGDDGLDAMLGLLRTFMKRGGYGYQGNVLDSKTLRDAQVHPEKYENLQVRICGWNWYFTKMDKVFQDEFIKRAELEEMAG